MHTNLTCLQYLDTVDSKFSCPLNLLLSSSPKEDLWECGINKSQECVVATYVFEAVLHI